MTAVHSPTDAPQSRVWELLHQAHDAYEAATPKEYDEVLYEVADRIRDAGSVGKADIGALLLWKRLRANTPWARRLMLTSDAHVRTITKDAVAAVTDTTHSVPEAAAAGRQALLALPGFKNGDALASALLLAAAPERMAVYDRRAQSGLKTLGFPLSTAPGRYARYMHLVEELKAIAECYGHPWTARDVDVALYKLGG